MFYWVPEINMVQDQLKRNVVVVELGPVAMAMQRAIDHLQRIVFLDF